MSVTGRIRVLVVDDSAIARRFISARLEKDPEIDLLGAADSGTTGLEHIRRDPPDVVVLDEEMPDMRGRDVLRIIRKEHPTVAVVMFSARVGKGSQARFEALLLGADDAVAKPVSRGGPVTDNHPTWTELLTKAKSAARHHTRGGVDVSIARAAPSEPAAPTQPEDRTEPGGTPAAAPPATPATTPPTPTGRAARSGPTPSELGTPVRRRTTSSTTVAPPPQVPPPPPPVARPRRTVVATAATRTARSRFVGQSLCVIASSTGGPDALTTVFASLPADFPLPILIAQHMPPHFTKLLADRIDGRSALHVVESQGGEVLAAGTAYIAPGDHHLVVDSSGPVLRTGLTLGPPENSCRPAADVLFRSAVDAVGGRILSCVISGMGHDGRDGATLIHEAGGTVIAQDEDSSVVWGMPGAVVDAGVADAVVPLDRLATELTGAARRVAGGRRTRKANA